MSLTASLPMYRFEHTAAAWDTFWRLVAGNLRKDGIAAPLHLVQPDDLLAHWTSPDLLLSQTCSMPYRQGLHTHVSVIGAWDLGLKDCPPGCYNSVLVRRKGAARPWRTLVETGRVAVNGTDSQSGWQALIDLTGRPPRDPLISGAHRASVAAVREGRADICAIDAESWRLIVEAEGGAQGVEVCHRTPPTPGLPLVTAKGRDPAPLRRAMEAGLAQADACLRATLHLHGLVRRRDADYAA